MKGKLLIPILFAALPAAMANAQIVTSGDFEAGSDSAWTKWEELIGQTTLTYNYTTDGPTGGSGGALRVESTGASNGGAYQQVTLTGGNSYRVEGLVKEVAGSPTSTWFEVFMSQTQPVDGSNVGGTNVTKVNTWVCDGYDGSFTAGCETPNNGEFTVPGTGSQTWYLILKSGVCCGGGPGEYVVDNIVITDLGAGPSFDAPPTPLVEPFDATAVNNYGGEYRAFAGGDPGSVFTSQDASMEAVPVDAQGTTGLAGDYALHVHATTPLAGASFIYYGAVCSIIPNENGGQNLTSFATLSFDIKLGNASSTTDWVVRLEDSSATNENAGSYNYIDLDSFTTSTTYAHVEIPLADFVSAADGGTIAPNLSSIDVITFAGENVNALATNPDIYIDNLQLNTTSNVADWQMY
jgi:hypothetical protein